MRVPGQAVVLLDGKPITDFTFANGIFRTTSPLSWTTPGGEAASVHLHLQFSVFAGYGEAGFLSSYLGVQVWLAGAVYIGPIAGLPYGCMHTILPGVTGFKPQDCMRTLRRLLVAVLQLRQQVALTYDALPAACPWAQPDL